MKISSETNSINSIMYTIYNIRIYIHIIYIYEEIMQNILSELQCVSKLFL